MKKINHNWMSILYYNYYYLYFANKFLYSIYQSILIFIYYWFIMIIIIMTNNLPSIYMKCSMESLMMSVIMIHSLSSCLDCFLNCLFSLYWFDVFIITWYDNIIHTWIAETIITFPINEDKWRPYVNACHSHSSSSSSFLAIISNSIVSFNQV